MSSTTRRAFLKASLGAAGAFAALRPARATDTAPGFRLFACDWTLQKTCSPDAFALAARLGLEGVKTPLGVEPSIRYDLDYLRPLFPRSV